MYFRRLYDRIVLFEDNLTTMVVKLNFEFSSISNFLCNK